MTRFCFFVSLPRSLSMYRNALYGHTHKVCLPVCLKQCQHFSPLQDEKCLFKVYFCSHSWFHCSMWGPSTVCCSGSASVLYKEFIHTRHITGRLMASKEAHIPIPGTWEYVTLHIKRDLMDVFNKGCWDGEIILYDLGRPQLMIWALQRTFPSWDQGGAEEKRKLDRWHMRRQQPVTAGFEDGRDGGPCNEKGYSPPADSQQRNGDLRAQGGT